ncbi:MAG: hypothetical protein E6J32_11660 [Chloroflexi bacterium]|nr:MAG: hypothetical protein E6J32_11660 [Chloroflexota bacterium]
MTGARRGGLAALALGLIAAALLHGRGGPPVFDGIVVPPEPYRWESPPPNLRAGNKPPLSGEATFPVANGQVPGGGVQTGDRELIYEATSITSIAAPNPAARWSPPSPPST